MNMEPHDHNLMKGFVRWGAQTVGYAINVKDYRHNDNQVVYKSGRTAKLQINQMRAISQSLWDVTVEQVTDFDEAPDRFSTYLFAWIYDFLGEVSPLTNSDTLAFLKSEVNDAISKCSEPPESCDDETK